VTSDSETKRIVLILAMLGAAKGLLKATPDEPTRRFLERRIRTLLKKLPPRRRKTLLNLFPFL